MMIAQERHQSYEMSAEFLFTVECSNILMNPIWARAIVFAFYTFPLDDLLSSWFFKQR